MIPIPPPVARLMIVGISIPTIVATALTPNMSLADLVILLVCAWSLIATINRPLSYFGLLIWAGAAFLSVVVICVAAVQGFVVLATYAALAAIVSASMTFLFLIVTQSPPKPAV